MDVARPQYVEFPRSITEVVVHWNIPMHVFLKNCKSASYAREQTKGHRGNTFLQTKVKLVSWVRKGVVRKTIDKVPAPEGLSRCTIEKEARK